MTEEFDPDEPLAFGQVWKYLPGETVAMVIVPGEFTQSIHLQSSYEDIGMVDPVPGGWASLIDHLAEYWERLA